MRVLLVIAGLFALQAATPRISIESPSIQQFEDGPPLAASFIFYPGDFVNFSFLIAGYQVSKTSEVKLEHRIEVLDPKGVPLVEAENGKVETEVSAEDQHWMPKVRRAILIPSTAPTGTCHIRATVKDVQNGTEAVKEVPFALRGHEVEPSDTLVVRNVRFLRTEEDRNPLAAAAYRPGDELWARFDIIGYKLGDKNRVEVEYGLSVLRANGEVLYTQPKAAEESDESFYPKRFVPGILNLKLQTDLKRAEYAILLTARDRVGNQNYETRLVFQVE